MRSIKKCLDQLKTRQYIDKDGKVYHQAKYEISQYSEIPDLEELLRAIEDYVHEPITSISYHGIELPSNYHIYNFPVEKFDHGWILITYLLKSHEGCLDSSYSVLMNEETLDMLGPFSNDDEG